MSDQSPLRRPLVLASIGITTAAVIYLILSSKKTNDTPTGTLHRSNAVRRPRRRWRRGFTPPQDVSPDIVAQAIRALDGRIAAGLAYGTYENRLLLNITQEELDNGHYDLLPQNLGPLYRNIIATRDMTDLEQTTLNHHIESIFLQNFLRAEFPAGYIIASDVESLVHALRSHGINEQVIRMMVERFDTGQQPTPVNWDLRDQVRPDAETAPVDGDVQQATAQAAFEALGGQTDNIQNGRPFDDDAQSDPGGSQGMLDLLYHIAGEQAKRDGFIHRGVRCNSCGVFPIQGIRYHCANCFDYDLCEICEAQQIHIRSHVFYKIRIPAPSRGQIKEVMPVWYPGQPNHFPASMPKDLSSWLCNLCRIEKTELESYYEQFKCLAGHSIPLSQDVTLLGMAIDRKGFDRYFTTGGIDRPPQSLLYDRIFAFYDANFDNVITFDEFVRGMTSLQDTTRAARVRRLFQAYDLDGDDFVDRKDFLRMFRAHYAWHKEVDREVIKNQVEMDEDLQEAIHNSHPISQAFGWSEFASHASRGGRDKIRVNGDFEVVSGPQGVLQNDTDTRGDRAVAIANAGTHSDNYIEARPDEPVMMPPIGISSSSVFVEGDGDPPSELSNHRRAAVERRWQRRQFYLDEQEGMTKPPGYTEPDSDSEGEEEVRVLATTLSSRRQSMRSRSSSKVRFEDSAVDTDYETRSNTSSRSIPVNERWGGFELSEPEKDIGKEILYQAIQQGFNELLDPLFREVEDLAIEAIQTKPMRVKWRAELDAYEERRRHKSGSAHPDSPKIHSDPLQPTTPESSSSKQDETSDADQTGPESAPTHQPVEPAISTATPSQEPIDTTLPQFRPNDEFTSSILRQSSTLQDSILAADTEPKTPTPPDEATLGLWSSHRAIDHQSISRGGYGKLSFKEFKRKMVSESILPVHGRGHTKTTTPPIATTSAVADTSDPPSAHPPTTDPNTSTTPTTHQPTRQGRTNEDETDDTTSLADSQTAHSEDEELWNSTADLGRLAFLSSWLEMARF